MASEPDLTWYPETDDVGEHELQRFIAELLRPLVERWLREEGRVAHAGADQYFYWVPGDKTKGRAPDVYVVDGVPQDIPEVGTWKTWEGHRPLFALEICGTRWQKDYDEAPASYDAMGAQEVVIFDPRATSRSRRRVRWQVYRRDVRGRLVRVVAGTREAVPSVTLGCWLRAVEDRGHLRLRIGTGPRGETLLPTDAECAEAERVEKEVERAAKEAALQEVAVLRAELERLRNG